MGKSSKTNKPLSNNSFDSFSPIHQSLNISHFIAISWLNIYNTYVNIDKKQTNMNNDHTQSYIHNLLKKYKPHRKLYILILMQLPHKI